MTNVSRKIALSISVVLKNDENIRYTFSKLKDEEDYLMSTSLRSESFRLPPLSSQKLLELSKADKLINESKQMIKLSPQKKIRIVQFYRYFQVILFLMDIPLCIKETLENITAPLVERDSAHFIQKSAHSLAHILKFDGLLFLKLNGERHLSERFIQLITMGIVPVRKKKE